MLIRYDSGDRLIEWFPFGSVADAVDRAVDLSEEIGVRYAIIGGGIDVHICTRTRVQSLNDCLEVGFPPTS